LPLLMLAACGGPKLVTCPAQMAHIESFCVDRYEASVLEIDDAGPHPHSPLYPVDNLVVRAVAVAGVRPQGYISQLQAADACALAGKRLCTAAEFSRACRGPDAGSSYPYGGTTRRAGACNEGKGSSLLLFPGADLNDPRLNAWDGGLATTGEYAQCVSADGVYDCVGNLHEWSAEPPDVNGHGRFRGGFYGDAELNGPGCSYVTSAHAPSYHDYSTGFRCCADAGYSAP
jgi:sulfatase modifying factor 1